MSKAQIQNPTELSPLSKPLTPELRAQVQERRDAIFAAWTKIEDAASQLKRLEELRAESLDKLNAAEQGVDVPDAKGAAAMAGLREQHGITARRQQSLKDQTQPRMDALAGALEPLSGGGSVIHRALTPELALLIETITTAFRPHYLNLQRARVVAEQSDSVAAFRWFLRYSWQTFALEAAPKALATLDVLLAGKNPWRFESTPEGNAQNSK